MADYKKHREFIHDFANFVTITEGALRRAKKLAAEEDLSESDDIIENLDVALKYVKRSTSEIRNYRQYIHMLEKQHKS